MAAEAAGQPTPLTTDEAKQKELDEEAKQDTSELTNVFRELAPLY